MNGFQYNLFLNIYLKGVPILLCLMVLFPPRGLGIMRNRHHQESVY